MAVASTCPSTTTEREGGVLLSAVDVVVVLCLAVQFAIAGYFLYLIYWLEALPPAAEQPPLSSPDLPRVLVQIPVYNEPLVVERALTAAAALDWPSGRLTIQLLDDSTDITSDIAGHAIARLRREDVEIVHVRRADRSGFKAGALAAGMALCDAPFVAVFDADFVPAPDWLRRAMAAMLANPSAAFVQTRIEWGNGGHNWLTRAQRLMQDAHFAVEQDVRARRGVPFQFNGTGGIWRRAAVEEAGGWSHDTLSEDLDLVLRTHLKGWSGVFLMEPHVVGELPQKIDDFGAQQSRWSKGFVQVARKLIGPIWKSDWSTEAKLATTVQLGQQLIFPVLVVGIVALGLSILGHGRLLGGFRFCLWLWLATLLVVLIGMTWGAYRRLERGGVVEYAVTAASIPVLIVYLAVANAGAIVGAGFGRKTEFNRTPKTGS
jgi:cellulose synthase/poly-beta-1,6-N-acetylglucosamine synthase-like glycosyltransferase